MGPFIKDKNDSNKNQIYLLIALIPIILFALIKKGQDLSIINLILLPSITFILEGIFNLITEKNIKYIIKDNFGILKGLIIALLLPNNTPLVAIVTGIVSAIIITKILFLIFKKEILNGTVLSLLIIYILVKIISPNTEIIDQTIANQNITNIGTYETLIKPYGRLINILIGNIEGMLCSMSSIIGMLIFAYLILVKAIKWKIPTTYILTVFAMTYVIGGTNDLGIWYSTFQVITCGLIFKAIFLAADNETSPVTSIGQIFYGIGLGIITVLFRYLTPIPEGILISVLIMNILTPILDRIGAIARFDFKKTIIPFLITWILIIGLSVGISIKYKNPEPIGQPNIEN